MRWALFIIAFGLLESCFLLRDHKRRAFTYTNANGSAVQLPMIVPKKYIRQEVIKDSLGSQGVLYRYSGGSSFYILYAPTLFNYQPYDTSLHIPQPFGLGGVFYKGIDSSSEQWWREAHAGVLRIGYLKVEHDREVDFDSAVNYMRPTGLERKRR